MTTIEKILDLFDELDGYECIDLIKAMAERGYELKINYALEKEKGRILYGLFLAGLDESSHKIQAIKMIRNTGPENKQKCAGFTNMSLREAKDFVETPENWEKVPFAWGRFSDMKIIYERTIAEYFPFISVDIKELSEDYRWDRKTIT
jgi:ribosomal protein L7/L12